MRRTILTLLWLATACIGPALGQTRKENRGGEAFGQVENLTSVNIRYHEASAYRVEVVGTPQDVAQVQTSLHNGLLRITTRGNGRIHKEVHINLYAPQRSLQRYHSRGSGDFKAHTALHLGNAQFSLSGTGDVALGNVTATSLDITNQGSGDIEVRNAQVSERLNISNRGSGDVELKGRARQIAIRNNGSGDVDLDLRGESLKVQNNGSGDLVMEGRADRVATSQRGMGKLVFRNRNRNAQHTSPSNQGNKRDRIRGGRR